MNIVPGNGSDCDTIKPNGRKPMSPAHFHVDNHGYVLAYYGPEEKCEDYRKAHVKAALQRGETV